MKMCTEEALRLLEALPPEKAGALLEFARFLAEKADEEEWERRFSDVRYDPKLRARLAEVDRDIAAGRAAPLDVNRL
ncbi:MAG: hypothetical protein NTW87_21260 [Planctomycetota bacterium]|nr:hypothetical protein [Planctomycetota bacterium]